MSKLAIGSAQFGLDYGIGNGAKVSGKEVKSIMSIGQDAGIDTIDTAIAYGDSEKTLGIIGVDNWKLVTKLPGISENCPDITQHVGAQVDASLERLRVEQLEAVLLHSPEQLLTPKGDKIYSALQSMKMENKTRGIGISIYDPEELERILPYFDFDIVQAPLNVVDRRLISSGWLDKLYEKNMDVHIRSVFLQGLLIMKPSDRPSYFDKWIELWSVWDNWLKLMDLNPIEVCLNYILRRKEISRVIVGVENHQQLKQLVSYASSKYLEIPNALSCEDQDLINPSCWNVA